MSGSRTRPGLHIFYIMNIGQYVRWEWARRKETSVSLAEGW